MVVKLQNVTLTEYNYARFYHDDADVCMIIAVFRLPAFLISYRVDLSPRCTNLISLLILIQGDQNVPVHVIVTTHVLLSPPLGSICVLGSRPPGPGGH
jgi:hypothetical protein